MNFEKIVIKSSNNINEKFYNLCSKKEESLELKKILLKLEYKNLFTSEVLSYGIVSTVFNKQEENFKTLNNYMKKYQIQFDENIIKEILSNNFKDKKIIEKILVEDFFEKYLEKDLKILQYMYNKLSEENTELAEKINVKFNILQRSFLEDGNQLINLVDNSQSLFAEFNEDGSLELSGSFGGALEDNEIDNIKYNKNPINFNFENFNKKILDIYFSKNNVISSNLVENIIVKCIYDNNQEGVRYLFNNESCKNIIMNNSKIINFIKSKENFEENKNIARIMLNIKQENEISDKKINKI